MSAALALSISMAMVPNIVPPSAPTQAIVILTTLSGGKQPGYPIYGPPCSSLGQMMRFAASPAAPPLPHDGIEGTVALTTWCGQP